jgi:hypothetical protein
MLRSVLLRVLSTELHICTHFRRLSDFRVHGYNREYSSSASSKRLAFLNAHLHHVDMLERLHCIT